MLPAFENPAKWIVENCLFGVDIDAKAIEICQNTLQEKSGFLCPNIRRGNSLVNNIGLSLLPF
jgi:hypothetical protein